MVLCVIQQMSIKPPSLLCNLNDYPFCLIQSSQSIAKKWRKYSQQSNPYTPYCFSSVKYFLVSFPLGQKVNFVYWQLHKLEKGFLLTKWKNLMNKYYCIPTTFNNPLKAFFLIRNIYYNPNAPDTNCKSIFLNEKTRFQRIFKDYWYINSITYHFFSELACDKISKVRYFTPAHTNI